MADAADSKDVCGFDYRLSGFACFLDRCSTGN
jgi:hypothetical protein